MQDYRGAGLTNNLLQINVTGDSDAEAVARAKALADAFVADHVRRIREAAKAEAKALLDQRDRMQDELAQVNKSIGDAIAETSGPKASANLESLFARRAELTSRITDFGQRAAEARIGTPQLVAGTQIVDAPRAVRHSLPRTAATDAAIGFVLGLVPRARGGRGRHGGGGPPRAAPGDRGEPRRLGHRGAARSRSAGPWQRRRIRAARERLTTSLARAVRGSAEPVSLLELGCARSTSVIALDLARALAAEGPVVVVDGLPGRQLAGAARNRGTRPWSAASVPRPCRTRGAGSASARWRPARRGPTSSTSAPRPCSSCAPGTAAPHGCTPWRGSSRTSTFR